MGDGGVRGETRLGPKFPSIHPDRLKFGGDGRFKVIFLDGARFGGIMFTLFRPIKL